MNIICPLPYIPLRKTASHTAEQVSQLLYGETATVIESEGEWQYVKCTHDEYQGWLEKKCVKQIANYENNQTTVKGFARIVNIDGSGFWLTTGCELASELIDTTQSTVVTINPDLNNNSVIDLASQFLGTPYLWGGRSFMGIDCSGFVQVIFKALNIQLPRDASQQVDKGEVVQFTSDTKAGDLAFFDNEEGAITHVGITLGNGQIIHASGSVRIDRLDQQGIYNLDLGKYTHKLRIIKRL